MSPSSSAIVTAVPVTVPLPSPESATLPETVADRSAACRVKSSTGVKSNLAVPLVWPAGMVMLNSESSTVWKWVPSVVPAPAPTLKSTVSAFGPA